MVGVDDGGRIRMIGGGDVEVGGTRFYCGFPIPKDKQHTLAIMKEPEMLAPYEALCRELGPRSVVELGIRQGGSTAFLYEVARPDKLVAVDLQADSAPNLDDFIRRRALGEVVRTFYGVDQADRATLSSIVEDEFGGPLDLVVDDASHLYEATVVSFETLFPRLRPGGRYVIEDWTTPIRGLDRIAAAMVDPSPAMVEALARKMREPRPTGPATVPLAKLALELALLRASISGAVASVHIEQDWIVVVRGDEPLGVDFRLGEAFIDHFDLVGRRRVFTWSG